MSNMLTSPARSDAATQASDTEVDIKMCTTDHNNKITEEKLWETEIANLSMAMKELMCQCITNSEKCLEEVNKVSPKLEIIQRAVQGMNPSVEPAIEEKASSEAQDAHHDKMHQNASPAVSSESKKEEPEIDDAINDINKAHQARLAEKRRIDREETDQPPAKKQKTTEQLNKPLPAPTTAVETQAELIKSNDKLKEQIMSAFRAEPSLWVMLVEATGVQMKFDSAVDPVKVTATLKKLTSINGTSKYSIKTRIVALHNTLKAMTEDRIPIGCVWPSLLDTVSSIASTDEPLLRRKFNELSLSQSHFVFDELKQAMAESQKSFIEIPDSDEESVDDPMDQSHKEKVVTKGSNEATLPKEANIAHESTQATGKPVEHKTSSTTEDDTGRNVNSLSEACFSSIDSFAKAEDVIRSETAMDKSKKRKCKICGKEGHNSRTCPLTDKKTE